MAQATEAAHKNLAAQIRTNDSSMDRDPGWCQLPESRSLRAARGGGLGKRGLRRRRDGAGMEPARSRIEHRLLIDALRTMTARSVSPLRVEAPDKPIRISSNDGRETMVIGAQRLG